MKIWAFVVSVVFSLTVLAEPVLDKNLKPEQLRVYGDKSPVTLYVFTSYSCPHCAVFHERVLPELKKMVDAKAVQIVLVEMPYDARAMTGTMLARCLPAEQYEQFSKVMYDNQRIWSTAQDPKTILTGYAKLSGMSDKGVTACLTNKALQKAITEQRNNLSGLYNITGMPSVAAVGAGKTKVFVGTDTDEIVRGIKKEMNIK